MLDLSLFRKPSFAGVSIVAFALSAGMFAMFLYLTLYIQDVLGYSPLEAGLRFLPLTVLSFVVAPISGRLLNRVPARAIMGAGLILVGARAAADARDRGRRQLDDAAAGLPRRRDRDRDDQSRDRLGRDRGRRRRPGRDGVGDQQHLPPGRDRDRRRRARRDLPVADRARSSASCCRRRRRRSPRPSPPGRRRARSPRCRRSFARRPPDAANHAFVSGLNEILLVGAAIALRGRDRRLAAGPPARPGRPPGRRGAGAGRARAADAGWPARPPGRIRRRPPLKRAACCTSCGSRTCS